MANQLITAGAFKDLLTPETDAVIDLIAMSKPQYHEDMFEKASTKKAQEVMTGMLSMGPGHRRSDGESVKLGSISAGYRQIIRPYNVSMGGIITDEAVEDNIHTNMAARLREALGDALYHARQLDAAEAYDTAFLGSVHVTPDGLPWLAANHSFKKNGSVLQDNLFATSMPLSEAALDAMHTKVMDLVDGTGISYTARIACLIVPTALENTAKRITKSVLTTNGANSSNAVNLRTNEYPIIVTPFLKNQNQWFVRTTISDGPTFWERAAVKTESHRRPDMFATAFYANVRYALSMYNPFGLLGSGN